MTVDLVSGDTRPLSSSHTSNWVARNGGLPGRVRAIARALMKRGMTESQAIAVAINTIKRTAATGRVFGGRAKAKAETRAAHTGATAEWYALRARAHAHSLELPAVDLAVTIGSSTDGNRMVLNAFTRRMLAKKKKAMPDGSFPIQSKADVGKAQRAIGRAPASKRPAVRAHINRRKRALGMSK